MNLKIYFNQIIFLLLIPVLLFSQQISQSKKQFISTQLPLLNQDDLIRLSPDLQSKVLSGKLIQGISQKKLSTQNSISSAGVTTEQVVIYVSEYPTQGEITALEEKNVKCYLDLWTPPMENHPYGFFIAEMPIIELNEVLSFGFVKRMDTAEYQNYPQNNSAAIAINSDDVWLDGFDGTGVKVAVLDSGLDDYYDGTDLPASIDYEKKDYSAYPALDDNVANTVTGHGTHVAGSVLGRGALSVGRTDDENGATAFKGSAPDADLVFLKIGGDVSSSASSTAMIGAMNDAVTIYNADILTMSYGGWYTYHDGSSSTEQKVDWVYEQGVPFFLSAGNSGNDDHHYSGTLAGSSETGFIAISTNAGSALSFNLVWYDGLSTSNDLYMEYYDPSLVLLASTNNITTESTRGTESKFSFANLTVPAGIYYVKVFNSSSNSQLFHIYFDDWGRPDITFDSPNPEYTIGQPASADNGFAVGAWVSRTIWYPSVGGGYWYGSSYVLDEIAGFSSRGPRVNGGVTKPNICAPGHVILSLRDTDVYTTTSTNWIDNDGILGGGDANYFQMVGTSMACPIVAGAAALLLDITPSATPAQVYAAIQNNASTSGSGTVPNNTWGYGKLDIHAASTDDPFPVELTSFKAKEIKNKIILNWQTATEVNNYGFEIERASTSLTTILNEEISSRAESREWKTISFVEGHGNSNSPKDYNFIDDNFPSGMVKYRLKQIDTDGAFEYSEEIEIEIESAIENKLVGNYPNPFNPTTIIRFDLAKEGNVAIVVYNVIGEIIERLVDQQMIAGRHKIEFDASRLSSGIYFYQINAGNFVDVKKMMVIK